MPRRNPNARATRHAAALAAAVAALVCAPAPALAYIGPGAGFALGGSFLFAVAGILLAMVAVFLWPLRVAVRSWKGRRRAGRAKARRVIVVGLDGIDPLLCDEFMARGLLPNLQRLAAAGGYRRLATTLPPMSPVGWSTFATGTDAGGHAIFDFLGRDPRTHLPVLSSTRITETGRLRKLGPWVIGRPKARYELLRRSKPFWRTLAEHGVPSTILRVPITFPPDTYPGRMLSAMCVPDLRGTQGSFTQFTAPGGAPQPGESTGGTRLPLVVVEADHYAGRLPGPQLPTAGGGHATAELAFTVRRDRAAGRAHFELGEAAFTLAPDEYSPWIPLAFGRGRATAHGIARFRVTRLDDPLTVYVTPINLDPEHPDMPISHPPHYAIALAKLQGKFATLGLAEDTWALNERVIDEQAFLEQAYLIHQERRRQFLHALDRNPDGAIAVVFDATDRIQHMFWRYRVPDHPANRGQDTTRFKDAIEQVYAAGDAVVGETLARAGKDDVVLVISDHGFAPFTRGVNLNTWFRDHGYLFLRDDPREGPVPPLEPGQRVEPSAIDWSRTRAYTNGLAGFYLNLQGRERDGCVEPAQARALLDEIIGRLRGLPDPAGGEAIADCFVTRDVFKGPYRGEGPDVIVGYNRGWRTDWHAAVGRLTDQALRDNRRAWSGDHCMDPAQVPGVAYANRPLLRDDCALVDLAPTILDLFGIVRPGHMQGRSLFEET
ncbi:MAG: alkaline phosphatase family protein [Candidatus Krumholzibacteriia bacterium]